MSLENKTIVGILWNFAEQFSKRGFGIIVTLLLARFLTPEDYGLVAMMGVFLAITNNLMNMGFHQALIRKKNANNSDFSTAFYINFLLGIFSYLILFISAPLIATFYEEPRLIILIRVIGIVVLIDSFKVVQSAILSRNLNFKSQMKATVPATMISGVFAVVMAYAGFGVWALIVQSIVSSLLIAGILWLMDIWRPTLVFNKDSLSEMFGFGSRLFASDLLDTIFRNMYIVVIAKLFTATVAGHYFFVNKVKDLISYQLVNAIQTVTYPALATLQEDNIKLKAGYRKVIQITTFGLFPVMLFTAALAEPFFMVVLNEQWLPAVPYLQLMCIAALMEPLHSINQNVLKVKGRSDIFLYLEFIKKIIMTLILILTIQFGLLGILVGQIISAVLSYLPNSYYSGKLIGYSTKEQVIDFFPGLCLSSSIAIFIYLSINISAQPPLVELIFFGILAGLMYILMSYVFRFRAIKIIEELIKDNLKKNA
jgi:O-antigen/teichoic acid export membrane protein